VSMLERIKDENARDLPIVIVGNKVDLDEEREVTTAEGAAYARLIGAQFVEVSARTRVHIQKVSTSVPKVLMSVLTLGL
jgi:GTPase SAR1 family protein